VNTIDPDYFEVNIRSAYELRKIRYNDKNNGELEVDFEIYNLLKNSNQIVHNRGKALSYMNENKRARDPSDQVVRHEYEIKRKLGDVPFSERMRPGDGFKNYVLKKYTSNDNHEWMPVWNAFAYFLATYGWLACYLPLIVWLGWQFGYFKISFKIYSTSATRTILVYRSKLLHLTLL